MNTFLIYYITKWTCRDQDNLGAATASAISIPKNVKMPVSVKSTACFNPVLERERKFPRFLSPAETSFARAAPQSPAAHPHPPLPKLCLLVLQPSPAEQGPVLFLLALDNFCSTACSRQTGNSTDAVWKLRTRQAGSMKERKSAVK